MFKITVSFLLAHYKLLSSSFDYLQASNALESLKASGCDDIAQLQPPKPYPGDTAQGSLNRVLRVRPVHVDAASMSMVYEAARVINATARPLSAV